MSSVLILLLYCRMQLKLLNIVLYDQNPRGHKILLSVCVCTYVYVLLWVNNLWRNLSLDWNIYEDLSLEQQTHILTSWNCGTYFCDLCQTFFLWVQILCRKTEKPFGVSNFSFTLTFIGVSLQFLACTSSSWRT